jgi:septation ring formation regulator EzrA
MCEIMDQVKKLDHTITKEKDDDKVVNLQREKIRLLKTKLGEELDKLGAHMKLLEAKLERISHVG